MGYREEDGARPPPLLSEADTRLARSLKRRILLWTAISGAAVTGVLAVTAAVVLRPAHIRSLVVQGLTRHLNLDTSLEDVSISLFPTPTISGTRLELRLPHHPELPPFVTIEHFSVAAGLFSIIRKHVNTLHTDGLRIAVPPDGTRGGLPGGDEGPTADDTDAMSDVIVDHLISHDATLTFVPSKPADTPLEFALYSSRSTR